MDKTRTIAALTAAMTAFDRGDPLRIQHFVKVHALSRTIGILEGLEGENLFTLECAALVHDIAILPCEAELGHCNGKLQEQYGPGYARTLLGEFELPDEVVERVCAMVGHHHTYDDLAQWGLDFQILVEADFLVNLYEDATDEAGVRAAYGRIFRTETGRQLCRDMFGL